MPFNFICPHCGRTTIVAEEYAGRSGPCAGCGNTITIPPRNAVAPADLNDSAAIRMLLPVGRSIWAIAAGYMGLFSVLVFPAPFAIILGILAIRDIRKHPEKHGLGRAIFGLVMGIIGPILTIIGIIAVSTREQPGGFH
ncbi:MAG: DUF4190 domain-containing protein [Pirellulales bacterium]|nr:DUF4190 domain-containing protein [Pirellulales bacterium]